MYIYTYTRIFCITAKNTVYNVLCAYSTACYHLYIRLHKNVYFNLSILSLHFCDNHRVFLENHIFFRNIS